MVMSWLVAICLVALIVRDAYMHQKLKESNKVIERLTRRVRRQSKALRQAEQDANPVHSFTRDFGPGRHDLTAFFAQMGRAHLQHTDISELQSPTDD